MSCDVMSCHDDALTTCFVLAWYRKGSGMPCHQMSCHAVISSSVMPCHVMLCLACVVFMSCDVMPSHIVLCHAMS